MINPKLRAKDRIFSSLPSELKELMRAHILPEDVHMKVLKDIMESSYQGKTPVENPRFIMVVGQTGSGKSNLTVSKYSKDNNIVVIDSDKYKGKRPDSADILREHLVEYAYLTAPDAYLHRDEMIVDALSKKYNILMECATSQKEGLFIDISKLTELGYRVEVCALGVSPLNSLLSVHERYEAELLLNNTAAKLTSVARHDDSFASLNTAIANVQNMPGVVTKIYERGKGRPYLPKKIYATNRADKTFTCALEALMHTQAQDELATLPDFETRYEVVKKQMEIRNAPTKQREQLEVVKTRFDEKMKKMQEKDE